MRRKKLPGEDSDVRPYVRALLLKLHQSREIQRKKRSPEDYLVEWGDK